MAIPTRAELDAALRQALADDPTFRGRLLADPRAVISEVAGVEIPDFLTVTVHEESLTDVHLVIPAAAGETVAEDDLELVAGGSCWGNNCGIEPCWI